MDADQVRAIFAEMAAARPAGRPRLTPEQLQAAKVRKTERQRERRHEASATRVAAQLPCGCGTVCTFNREQITARRARAVEEERLAQAAFNAARAFVTVPGSESSRWTTYRPVRPRPRATLVSAAPS